MNKFSAAKEDWRDTFAQRHAACREHAESALAATEKFRAKAANPDGLVPPPVLRNSEPLRNFLRGGERLHQFRNVAAGAPRS